MKNLKITHLCSFLLLFLFSQTAFAQEKEEKIDQLIEEGHVFKVVEEMPRFPGCEDKEINDKIKLKECAEEQMIKFIYGNIQYPAEARENGIKGKVILKYTVEKDGSITDIKIMREPGGGCGEEAVRVVESMPNWIPGKQHNKLTRVSYVLPVRFNIEDRKTSKKRKTKSENLPIPETEKNDSSEEPVFKVVEEMPRFPGCEKMKSKKNRKTCSRERMKEFLYHRIKYPAAAKKKGIGGKVVVRLLIEKDGTIGNIELLRNPGGGCGDEVVRVIKTMPFWIPGKQNGKAVNVYYTLSWDFTTVKKKNNAAPVSPKEDQTFEKGNMIDASGEIVYKVVDEMPRFPGCEEKDDIKKTQKCSDRKLKKFIKKNRKYPEQAWRIGIMGDVIVDVIIGKDGKIEMTELKKNPGNGLGAEALRIIELMPNWVPAKRQGKYVKARTSIIVKFQLGDFK